MLIVFDIKPDLPTQAQLDEAVESVDGAGLTLLGMNGTELACICIAEFDLAGAGDGEGEAIVVDGLPGKLSDRKIRGNRTILRQRSTKLCSAGLVSIKVSRDAKSRL